MSLVLESIHVKDISCFSKIIIVSLNYFYKIAATELLKHYCLINANFILILLQAERKQDLFASASQAVANTPLVSLQQVQN